MISSDLFAKYDVPVPRYTSYPTVPQWHAAPTTEEWIECLSRAATEPDAALAVYIHLPFCESQCSFCGCNNVITRDHSREGGYVDLVLRELATYVERTPALRAQPFQQLHLGGGTPTFLSADELARLVDGVRASLGPLSPTFEGSVEVDPRVTTEAQLGVLRDRGFTRVSLGVQDVDPAVQHLVNRHQPVEQTARTCESARRLGYTSINLDLIYGLPGQTLDGMAALADHVRALAPERLAVYSFARVPWIKPAQRRFRDDQIPVGAEKRALYEAIRAPLLSAGYLEIGMDHFSTETDSLAVAARTGRLHRNFMGYTEVHTTTLLGLGVSAISDTPDCYHQNEKVLTTYEKRVRAGEIPTLRGHLLSDDDRRRRRAIADLMTRFAVRLDPHALPVSTDDLSGLASDGVVHVDGTTLTVPAQGRPFLRNAAALFDAYLTPGAGQRTYSTSA
jgi:oxygen-independent coproporphyrinogen III oxidase